MVHSLFMSEFVRWLSNYDYAELRIEKGEETKLIFKDDEIKPVVGPLYGASVRILKNGSWGFASTGKESEIKNIIETAVRMAALTTGNVKLKELPIEKKKLPQKRNEINLEEKIRILQDAQKHARGKHIQNTTLNYAESHIRKEFYNSEGSEILEDQTHLYFSCICVARRNGVIQRGHERASSLVDFHQLNYDQICETASQKAERLLDALPPPKGRFTVIMDNEMTGVFSHEAIGHACEGDSIIERESILKDKLGKQIGNENITILDNPTVPDFGNYQYDEEGRPGKPALLIKDGVLKGYLTSREIAEELRHESNGHARAMDYAHVPIIRMSNTHFLPGKMKKEELFDGSAIYVKGMQGGSVDIFTGSYMFKAEEAWEIKNGDQKQLFRDVTLMGSILQTLNDVEAIARDFATNPGFCGKLGQSVPVSDGGPHIRVKNMALG